MAFDRTNTGTLGRNKRKEKDTHPEYTGQINIEGVEYWLSAWVKDGNGEKFFSLSVKPKDQAQQAPAKSSKQDSFTDDDIPF